MEDPTPSGRDSRKKDLKTKNVSGKSAKKERSHSRGRSVRMVENPILGELSHEMQEEIALHRVPRIYNTRSFCMFLGTIMRYFSCCCDRKSCDCCCDCCFTNVKRYHVMEEGTKRMEEEFDIVKIVKKIRHMQTMMNSTHLYSEKRRFKLAHTHANVIDMVSSDDNMKTGECVHRYKNQDRRMKVQAIEGEIEEEEENQEQE